jgi:hypothetical protein
LTPENPTRPTGWKPSRPGHPRLGAQTWTGAVESMGGRLIPVSQIKPFSRVWRQVPNLDQTQSNECVPTTWTMVLWVALVRMGLNPPPLSPDYVYTWVNGGRDDGSAPGDVIDAMVTHGVAPASFVPHPTLGPPGFSDAARSAALAYRLSAHVRITTWEEAVNAAYFGWCGGIDVRAGDGFVTDSRGVATVLPGDNNHEVFFGEAYAILSDGTPVLRGRNPWGPSWGVGGSCWLTPKHFERANEVHACTAAAVLASDPGLPPPLKAV